MSGQSYRAQSIPRESVIELLVRDRGRGSVTSLMRGENLESTGTRVVERSATRAEEVLVSSSTEIQVDMLETQAQELTGVLTMMARVGGDTDV